MIWSVISWTYAWLSGSGEVAWSLKWPGSLRLVGPLCGVRLWLIRGLHSLQIMWWGTRLTFHSHRILRHLTRLLLANGEYADAKRTFLLYVQLVTKGRQTSAGDVSLQLKKRPTSLPAKHPDDIADDAEIEREDADDDKIFLSMLLFGVRMFCRYGDEDDIAEAKRVIEIAQDVVGETPHAQKRWSPAMRANLLTCRGILAARRVDFGTC